MFAGLRCQLIGRKKRYDEGVIRMDRGRRLACCSSTVIANKREESSPTSNLPSAAPTRRPSVSSAEILLGLLSSAVKVFIESHEALCVTTPGINVGLTTSRITVPIVSSLSSAFRDVSLWFNSLGYIYGRENTYDDPHSSPLRGNRLHLPYRCEQNNIYYLTAEIFN